MKHKIIERPWRDLVDEPIRYMGHSSFSDGVESLSKPHGRLKVSVFMEMRTRILAGHAAQLLPL